MIASSFISYPEKDISLIDYDCNHTKRQRRESVIATTKVDDSDSISSKTTSSRKRKKGFEEPECLPLKGTMSPTAFASKAHVTPPQRERMRDEETVCRDFSIESSQSSFRSRSRSSCSSSDTDSPFYVKCCGPRSEEWLETGMVAAVGMGIESDKGIIPPCEDTGIRYRIG